MPIYYIYNISRHIAATVVSREQLRIVVSALFCLIISVAFKSSFEMGVRLVFNIPFELKIRMCSAINTNASLISHNLTFGAT